MVDPHGKGYQGISAKPTVVRNATSMKKLCQRQINTTDSAIDKFVYELYNLTPEEMKIVEDSN